MALTGDKRSSEPSPPESHFQQALSGGGALYRSARLGKGMEPLRTCAFGGKRD